jgi:hypothetical protein
MTDPGSTNPHENGCPRQQFWDAGEYEAPCTCGVRGGYDLDELEQLRQNDAGNMEIVVADGRRVPKDYLCLLLKHDDAMIRDLRVLAELRKMQRVGREKGLIGWYKTLDEILTETERRVEARHDD